MLNAYVLMTKLHICLNIFQNEARKMNHQEVVEEDRRKKLPDNWEQKRKRIEWEEEQEKKRKVYCYIYLYWYES